MAESEFEAVVAVMREHLWNRLGLVLEEFYTPAELGERWIAYGLERGDSAVEIADVLARHMHEKYALEWLPEVNEGQAAEEQPWKHSGRRRVQQSS